MKIRNITLLEYDGILSRYAEKKLPQKIVFAITKNMLIVHRELEAYRASLGKIIGAYKDFIEKDSDGNQQMLQIGIPKVDEEHADRYLKDVNELLNIETDVTLYAIDETAFDYEDSDRYDPLTAGDIINLQKILCGKDEF